MGFVTQTIRFPGSFTDNQARCAADDKAKELKGRLLSVKLTYTETDYFYVAVIELLNDAAYLDKQIEDKKSNLDYLLTVAGRFEAAGTPLEKNNAFRMATECEGKLNALIAQKQNAARQ